MSRSLVILLAFVAGWVDASSFVGLDHVMAAHVTGNLVVLAANIAEGFEPRDTLKLIVLPIFFVGVMAVTLVHDRLLTRHDDHRRHLIGLFRAEAVLLGMTGIAGAWVTLGDHELDFWLSLIVVAPAVTAMAIQNAAHRFYPVIGPATTVMTGNITQFFIDRTRHLAGRESVSKINDMPKDENLLPFLILAFGTGCALGAIATANLGNGSFLVASAVVVICSALLRSRADG